MDFLFYYKRKTTKEKPQTAVCGFQIKATIILRPFHNENQNFVLQGSVDPFQGSNFHHICHLYHSKSSCQTLVLVHRVSIVYSFSTSVYIVCRKGRNIQNMSKKNIYFWKMICIIKWI